MAFITHGFFCMDSNYHRFKFSEIKMPVLMVQDYFSKLFSSNTVYPFFHSTYSVLCTTNLNDLKYVNTHRCYDQGNR